jgi:hypothetical protein
MKKHKRETPEHNQRMMDMALRRELYHRSAAEMPPVTAAMLDHRSGKSKYIPAGQFKNIPASNF